MRLQFQNEFATLNYLTGTTDTVPVPLAKPFIDLTVVPEAENTIFYQQYRIDSLRLRNSDA
jgi:hypothetical protein